MTDSIVEEIEGHDGTCSREDCPINQGGRCAADHEDPFDCDDFEPSDYDDIEAESSTGPVQFDLPNGEALPTSMIELVTREHRTSTVAPLGVVGAGKTTLICLTFDQVRTGRETSWIFTHSHTTLGFARRNHDASFASGRGRATTPRTALTASGLNLHLGMRRADDDSPRPIIFVDLSGEHVQSFSAGREVDVVSGAIRRADHIPVVLNGEDLADPLRRQRGILQGRSLIARLAAHEGTDPGAVSIVVTKADLLGDLSVDDIVDQITEELPVPRERRFVTADRDGAGVERGHGVSPFLSHITSLPVGLAARWEPSARRHPSPLLLRARGSRG